MVERKFLNNTWIEISESAYGKNLSFFRKLIGNKPELAAVIKANAYGHGWQSMARLAAKYGADSFCVHSLEEALKLRRAGLTQHVLIMGHVPLARLEDVVKENFRIVVYNRETLDHLHEITTRLYKLVRIHLKLETGTFRQGIKKEDLDWFMERLKRTPRVMLESVYTHFANIEDTDNQEFAEYQIYCFKQMVKIIRESGYPILRSHAACTAASLIFPEIHFDMIRLGLGQYGLWPSPQTLTAAREKHGRRVSRKLHPVLTWKTRVSQVKNVAAENTIGYGRTYTTERDSRIAVLPVGYSDGYPRALSNNAEVLIQGRRAPVRGRICMNLMMVDITDIPGVALEDEVVLLGKQGRNRITADELAEKCDTINYEIVARINPDIPRLIVE